MHKVKRYLSFLALSLFIGLLMNLTFSVTAQALGWSDLEKLFTTNDQGMSFEQFTPEESLQINKQGYNEALTTTSDVKDYAIRIVNFALGFLGLIAVIIVVYGGVRYLTAAGEEEGATKGKKTITYAVIGLVIILGSFALVNTVISGAGGDGSGGNSTGGQNIGGSFNASANEVRTTAKDIYTGFVFLAESAEEIKNITSDAQKTSLNYGTGQNDFNHVSKNDIMTFMFSFKDKLTNMRAKVAKLSTADININDLIRQTESDIDRLQRMADCDSYETCSESALYKEWNLIKGEITSNDTNKSRSLTRILDPFKQDYVAITKDSIDKVMEIKQPLMGIEAVQSGNIGTLYNEMVGYYGYDPRNPGALAAGSFLKMIDGLRVDASAQDIDGAGSLLYKAIEKQLAFESELLKLQTVQVHLRANVMSGNAPLVVVFDVLDSVDPAGGSIVDSNVDWTNLSGNKTFTGEHVDIGGDAVVCAVPTAADQKIFGPAYRQCTFKYPGTYTSTVSIKSNDPTKYADGMSSLIIKVNPPTTKIELTLKIGNREIPVISYYSNGALKLDRDYIPVTLAEAKGGVAFDTTKTENVTNFRWDFGNDQKAEDAGGSRVMTYAKEGKYKVTLEVVNKLGEVDTKIFTIDVMRVAARIKVAPGEGISIDNKVTVDGTSSSASSGKITGYKWTISNIAQNKDLDLGDNATKSSFTYEFKEPGKYKIQLKVESDGQVPVEADPYMVVVQSKPPVAIFNYSIPSKTQPSTINFNAIKSFDPDGQNKYLEYVWTITPDNTTDANWTVVNNSSLKTKNPVVKFNKKGDYTVTLRVTDSSTQGQGMTEEYGEATTIITITDILDIAWALDQKVTTMINANNEAPMEFKLISDNAVAYEMDFGDGSTSTGSIAKTKTLPHTYVSAGQYTVSVTVYDSEDNDNSISKRIFIGGDVPIAKIKALVNDLEYSDSEDQIEANRKDKITFDASDSKNMDGTARNLKYNWDFGDTQKSSNKSAIHSYNELSPKDPGYYLVTLKVYDKNSPDKISKDTVKVKIVNKAPTFAALSAIPETTTGDLITPVKVNMKAYGADDADGEVIQYKWWYYDIDDPEEVLGVQITQTPIGKLTIGTNGKQGKEIKYGFGLEVMDSDNLTTESKDMLQKEQIPTITVKNGINAAPTAKFTTNNANAYTGDKIVFTSSSTDPDGSIVSYVWDFEGDGFFNNAPTNQSVVEHVYTDKNKNGYSARLKVIDDKGGEAVSTPVKIFVDSQASPPKSAFKFSVVEGSLGKKIKFTDNSTAGEIGGAQIVSYQWDFDTALDSDGDAVTTNDIDSQAKDPEFLYTKLGTHTVKLTVKDDHGSSDFASQTFTIPLTTPLAAFTYQVVNGQILFQNNSAGDPARGITIQKYAWDFNANVDSNGDGIKDNDVESELKVPVPTFTQAGQYNVKLSVMDSQGGTDYVTNIVNVHASAVGLPTDTANTGTTLPTQSQTQTLKATFATTPVPSSDGAVYINGDQGSVTFDFSKSTGPISYYVFDKNINIDSDGNGVKNDDKDFKTSLPGTWKTNFNKAYGATVVKLTVQDVYGNSNSTTIEIKFK